MDLNDEILDALLASAIGIVRDAGERILDVYQRSFSVTTKADETPLTEADIAANKLIIERLSELEPLFPVLSEESADVPFSERHLWNVYWLVDPLDGTREFIKGNGEFSINIALIENGQPILGVVYAPALDVMYFARRGSQAWKRAGAERPLQIHVRDAPPKQVIVARSRAPTTGPNLRRFLDALGGHDELSMGSALKSCLVAEGLADVYARLGPTSEWDTAAAQCIVEEAGGRVVDVKRQYLRYNTRDSLLNPHFLVFGDPSRDWTQYLRDCEWSPDESALG